MAEIVISDPHLIAELLPVKEQKRNLVLLGLKGELNQNEWRAELEIIFMCIDVPMRMGISRRKYYHIGCSGATATIRIEKGTITSYNNDKKIKTNLTKRVKVISQQNISINPSLEVASTKFAPGKIDTADEIESEYISSVECQEREIVITSLPNSISWRIERPRLPMLIRDYLLGNFPFKATVNWYNDIKSGSFELVPLSVDFFNEKNELISGTKAVLFEFLLWRKKIKILNKKGLEFKFHINE